MGLQGTGSSLIQPHLNLLTFRLCLMINSVGDFVAVTMPFVSHNPRQDPMTLGNNFKMFHITVPKRKNIENARLDLPVSLWVQKSSFISHWSRNKIH